MIRFDGRVAVVTGAGAGLGRAHALALAARGARVVVNDVADPGPVVDAIHASGGEALADRTDVSDPEAVRTMVETVMAALGRVDILVNNAGVLRDRSFGKMTMAEVERVLAVHLTGSLAAAHAVWPHMRAAGYGRIVFTSSGSGLYGNFGQANYGAAKAGMVGLMNVLHLEGARHGIHVNTLAPTAATQMTEGLLPADAAALLAPETVTPGLVWLVSEEAPSGMILAAGAGCFAEVLITETPGICLAGEALDADTVASRAGEIRNPSGARALADAFTQTRNFAQRAAEHQGLDVPWGEV